MEKNRENKRQIVVLVKKMEDLKGLIYFLPEVGINPIFFEKEENLINFIRENKDTIEVVTVTGWTKHFAGLRLKIKMIKSSILFIDAIDKRKIVIYSGSIRHRFFPESKIRCAIPDAISAFLERDGSRGRLWRILPKFSAIKVVPHYSLALRSYTISNPALIYS